MSSLLVFLAALACASAVSIPHTHNAVSIVPSVPRSSGAHPLALSGVGNCGTADILDVRMTGCSSAPCVLQRGQSYNMEIDFRVTGNREFGNVFFRSLVLREHVNQLVTDTVFLEGTKLVPGGEYTFNYDFTIPTGDFTGTDSELRLNVFQNMNKPLCVVIPGTLQ